MTWEAFWAPNLVQWIVGGIITAVVGAAAGLITRFLLKRWYDRVLKPSLEAWLKDLTGVSNAAEQSAVRMEAHAAAATKAADDVRTTALELKEANGRSIGWLPEKKDALEYLKEQNSRVVAQLVIQASKHPEDFDSPTAPRPLVPQDELDPFDDTVWTTGRHHLFRRATEAVESDGPA